MHVLFLSSLIFLTRGHALVEASTQRWAFKNESIFLSRVEGRGFHVSIFLSRVEGRGFHVEGEGTKSRVEGNIFFSKFLIIDAINVIKTNKKNLKNKWRVNIF